MLEVWKDVKGYEGLYMASDQGRIRSYYGRGRILKPITHGRYSNVNLCKDGKCKKVRVHIIIAITFLNHTPDGFKIVVDYTDNNPKDNRVSNLQLVTTRKNTTKDVRGASKYIGVCFSRSTGKWQAQIQVNGKHKYLGVFSLEEDAAEAYQNKLKEVENE